MSATDDLNNPHLFDENEPGNYTYTETAYGKTASGQLHTATSPDRDALAQRTAGGEDRRTAGNEYGVDDGGHLIGARFGGATGQENLTPQDRNLNRGDYKRAENEWADRLEKGDKVYVHMESYTGDGSDVFIVPEDTSIIDIACFMNSEFKSIILPDSVKQIKWSAFSGCKSMTNIVLPEGLETIGVECFENSNLENIVIPTSVKTIEEWAFF